MESEENGQLSFMDVMVMKENESLNMTIYRTPTLRGSATRTQDFHKNTTCRRQSSQLEEKPLKQNHPKKVIIARQRFFNKRHSGDATQFPN